MIFLAFSVVFAVLQGRNEQNQAIETLIDKGVVGNVLVIEKVLGISVSKRKPTNVHYYVEYEEHGTGIKVKGHIEECRQSSAIQIACLPSLTRAQSVPVSLKKHWQQLEYY